MFHVSPKIDVLVYASSRASKSKLSENSFIACLYRVNSLVADLLHIVSTESLLCCSEGSQ